MLMHYVTDQILLCFWPLLQENPPHGSRVLLLPGPLVVSQGVLFHRGRSDWGLLTLRVTPKSFLDSTSNAGTPTTALGGPSPGTRGPRRTTVVVPTSLGSPVLSTVVPRTPFSSTTGFREFLIRNLWTKRVIKSCKGKVSDCKLWWTRHSQSLNSANKHK